jgi:peptidoglycan/LPS O-acetylase OafA/YrhL
MSIREGGASKPRSSLGYFPAVDGLRALAVLAVIIFHLDEQGLRGGLVGVDIFFVISGFVVTASVTDLDFRHIGQFFGYFYARRIRRIYPALCVCLLVTVLLYSLFIPRAWLSDTIPSVGRYAFFGLSNIYLALHSDDYFSPQAIFNPFTHTWSLGVEEQFYLVFPVLMFVYQRYSHSPALKTNLSIGLFVLCVASLAIMAAATIFDHMRFAFYMLPARFWELGAGMLLCLTYDDWSGRLKKKRSLAATIQFCSLCAVLVAFFIPTRYFPWPMLILPVLGAVGLVAGVTANTSSLIGRAFSSRAMVYIGRISYSLYLWHWPVFVLFRWTVGLEGLTSWIEALTLTLLVSMASYHWIELPFRHRRTDSRSKSLVYALGSVAFIGVSFYCADEALANKDVITLSQTKDAEIWYPDGNSIKGANRACHIAKQTAEVSHIIIDTLTPEGCPRSATKGRLFVAGDSHALAYGAMLRRYALSSGRTVIMLVYPGCSFISFQIQDDACVQAESKMALYLDRNATKDDIIFLPSLRLHRFADQWGDAGNTAPPSPLASAVPRADLNALKLVEAAGALIVFEAPTPIFRSPAFRCADWFNAMNPACSGGFELVKSQLDGLRAGVLAHIYAIEKSDRRVTLWDPAQFLCDNRSCQAFDGAKPLFFDGDHLSGYANSILLPEFRTFIDRRWLSQSSIH